MQYSMRYNSGLKKITYNHYFCGYSIESPEEVGQMIVQAGLNSVQAGQDSVQPLEKKFKMT